MKLSFLTNILLALGLVTTVSAVVGTSIQQTVQAQNQNEVAAEVQQTVQAQNQNEVVAEVSFEGNCTEVMSSEAQGFYEFQGIYFTPEQEAAYQDINQESSEKAALSIQDVERDMDNAALSTVVKAGVIIPDNVMQEINAVSLGSLPDSEEIGELNVKYGQYVEFELIGGLLFTPEQLVERQARVEEFEAAMLAILTPEQQQVYLENIETKRAIEACSTDS
jgi:antitoxin component of MazEF toxin-antitoxin module